jgi:hypothetical protein
MSDPRGGDFLDRLAANAARLNRDGLSLGEVFALREAREADGRGHLNCQIRDCPEEVVNGHHCHGGHMQLRGP